MPKKKKTASKKTALKSAARKKKVVRKATAKKKKAAKKKMPRKTVAVKKKAAKKKAGKKKTASKTKAAKKRASVKKKKTAKKIPSTRKKQITAKKSKMNKVTSITKKAKSPRGKKEKQVKKGKFKPYNLKHGEEYMGPDQAEHFRQLLLNWKRELMEEVDRTVHHMRDEASNFPDPNDRATQEEEFALELRTRDRERKLIKKIDESLMNIDNGDYGYCEICGVEIGVRRLEARPTATLCIDCKTLDEIKERHLG